MLFGVPLTNVDGTLRIEREVPILLIFDFMSHIESTKGF